MFEGLVDTIASLTEHSSWLAILLAFVGGLLTASSPCVLAMIPLSIAYVGGLEGEVTWKRSLLLSLCMVLGLSVTFAALGVLASLLGVAAGGSPRVWSGVIAAVCLAVGLHMMEVVTIPIPTVAAVRPGTGGVVGALLLGVLFGFASTPCVGPVLAVLLAYLAKGNSSLLYGAGLLLAFGFGHAILVIVAGTSMGVAKGLLASERLRKWNAVLKKVAGGVLLAMGVYFVLQAI